MSCMSAIEIMTGSQDYIYTNEMYMSKAVVVTAAFLGLNSYVCESPEPNVLQNCVVVTIIFFM